MARSEGAAAGQDGAVWSGRTVLVSMAALLGEVMTAGAGLVLFGFTQEGEPPNAFLLGFGVPVLCVLGAVPGFALTITLVLPTLMLARWAARRGGLPGRPAWWLTAAAAPFAAAAATLAYGTFFALLTASAEPPLVYVVCWALLTMAALPAALLAAVVGRGAGGGRPLRPSPGVVGTGLASVAGFAVLTVVALATDLLPLYEPPHLDRASAAGVWEDDDGGTLRLRSDGRASAHRVGEPGDRCSGGGRWELTVPLADPDAQELRVTGGCPGSWDVGGTADRPTLYYFTDDPDTGRRYELTRRDD
ncbi:hypothetical protein FCH28_19645 [Streptomyces piniterrae]|uniref:Uncharacterized protein n=1 Tax=Streptomyces piniterrae TaxID=2571125 RepID=A0A4U0NDH9_9ACTN|nr:hypothetical protein [Streptomyces piniterrae]TJZ52059.1 hypothetical protein FCH28_19645 [Streptomyces piniterrae]